MQPFFFKTQGEAIRAWIDVVNDQNTTFAKHPEDYTLFEIAEYNEEQGSFNNYQTKITHGVALEYVKKRIGHPGENNESPRRSLEITKESLS